ncbi:MAG: hypothetical protein AAF697_00425 [Pseudomonadota bacterium]
MSDQSEQIYAQFGLSKFDFSVLGTVNLIARRYKSDFEEDEFYKRFGPIPQQLGWVTSARVREELGANSVETRKALNHLAIDGLLETESIESAKQYRLTPLGSRFLVDAKRTEGDDQSETVAIDNGDNFSVSVVQRGQILALLSEIEDVAEGITDNETRAQIFGLIRALKVLLDVPNPPKAGMLAIIRDPAFANLVQIATFLAAIAAVLGS